MVPASTDPPAAPLQSRVEKWWVTFGVALFLLVPVDLHTTLLAVARYGVGVESNPVVRHLIGYGLFEVVVANLVAAGLAVVLFHTVVRSVQQSFGSDRRALVYGLDVWTRVLCVAGVVVTANNLLVLVG